MLYLTIAYIVTVLVLGAVVIYLIKHKDEEKKDLWNRLMARDYREYSYYAEELPEFQKERQAEIKEKRKREKNEKPLTKEEREMKGIVERF